MKTSFVWDASHPQAETRKMSTLKIDRHSLAGGKKMIPIRLE
jgi:hypothetical protein